MGVVVTALGEKPEALIYLSDLRLELCLVITKQQSNNANSFRRVGERRFGKERGGGGRAETEGPKMEGVGKGHPNIKMLPEIQALGSGRHNQRRGTINHPTTMPF